MLSGGKWLRPGSTRVRGGSLASVSESRLKLIDRGLRATASLVAGCPGWTSGHALTEMAEAGRPTAASRRAILEARILGMVASLSEGNPIRALPRRPPDGDGLEGPRP